MLRFVSSSYKTWTMYVCTQQNYQPPISKSQPLWRDWVYSIGMKWIAQDRASWWLPWRTFCTCLHTPTLIPIRCMLNRLFCMDERWNTWIDSWQQLLPRASVHTTWVSWTVFKLLVRGHQIIFKLVLVVSCADSSLWGQTPTESWFVKTVGTVESCKLKPEE
jgi:hypothetical protein